MSESTLNRIAMHRLAPLVAWIFAITIVAVTLVSNKSAKQSVAPAPDVVAARDLSANHVLRPADLRFEALSALLDHALLEPVKAGKPVAAAAVSKAKAHSDRGNAIAAVIKTSEAVRAGAGIDVDSFVTIFRGPTPFGPPGRVIAVECDGDMCFVTVALPRTNRIIDPDALIDATLEKVAAPIAPAVPPPTLPSSPPAQTP